MAGHGVTSEKIKDETVAYQKSLRDVGRIIEKCTIIFLKLSRFVPVHEFLLLRQKDPKPCWPCRGPSDSLRDSPTPAVAQTRGAYPEPCRRAQTVRRRLSGVACTARPRQRLRECNKLELIISSCMFSCRSRVKGEDPLNPPPFVFNGFTPISG